VSDWSNINVVSGTYKIVFMHADAAASGDRTYVFELGFDPGNRVPDLSDGRYEGPSPGKTTDSYNFYVQYYDADGDPPGDEHHCYVSTSERTKTFAMSRASGQPSNGLYWTWLVNLPSGPTSYYFKFDDGKNTRRYPPGSASFPGPRINYRPEVTNCKVEPAEATPDQLVTYSCHYRDLDSERPVVKQVFIDGTPYDLTLIRGTEADGDYEKQIRLGTNPHTYSFKLGDGIETVEWTCGGTPCQGPTVGRPDFELAYFDTSPRWANPGQTVDATITIKNSGTISTPVGQHRIRIASAPQCEKAAICKHYKTFSSDPIIPGASRTRHEPVTIPAEFPAQWHYYVLVELDYEDQVPEQDEENFQRGFAPVLGYGASTNGLKNPAQNSMTPSILRQVRSRTKNPTSRFLGGDSMSRSSDTTTPKAAIPAARWGRTGVIPITCGWTAS